MIALELVFLFSFWLVFEEISNLSVFQHEMVGYKGKLYTHFFSLTLCMPWTYIYVCMCLCQQPRYVCFSNHRHIYASRICFTRNHTVLLAAAKDVYIRHTYVLPATKDVYIPFEYGYFLLSVVVHVDSFGRWYVVFSILHKKKSVFK